MLIPRFIFALLVLIYIESPSATFSYLELSEDKALSAKTWLGSKFINHDYD